MNISLLKLIMEDDTLKMQFNTLCTKLINFFANLPNDVKSNSGYEIKSLELFYYVVDVLATNVLNKVCYFS